MIDHLLWNNFSEISVVEINARLLRTGVSGCERVEAVSTDILFKKLIEL